MGAEKLTLRGILKSSAPRQNLIDVVAEHVENMPGTSKQVNALDEVIAELVRVSCDPALQNLAGNPNMQSLTLGPSVQNLVGSPGVQNVARNPSMQNLRSFGKVIQVRPKLGLLFSQNCSLFFESLFSLSKNSISRLAGPTITTVASNCSLFSLHLTLFKVLYQKTCRFKTWKTYPIQRLSVRGIVMWNLFSMPTKSTKMYCCRGKWEELSL